MTDYSSADNNVEYAKIDVLSIFKILKKWWWLIACLIALSLGLAALSLSRMQPIYMASSILEIKQQERQIFTSSDIEQVVVDEEFFGTQVELLKSTTLAETVVDNLNLMSDPDFSSSEEGTFESKRRQVINEFSKRLKIEPVAESRLIRVSFEHTNPKMAATVPNALIDKFISNNLQRKYNSTSYAREFIEEQLRQTNEVLEKSERDLVSYEAENGFLTLGSSDGNTTPGYLNSAALISLNAELTAAKTKRAELEQRYSLSSNRVNVPELQSSNPIASLKNQQAILNDQYIEKLAIYKPEFPEMLELKSRIDYLQNQIDAEKFQITDSVNSELKIQYDVAVAHEKNLQSRVDALKAEAARIRDSSVNYKILEREVDTNRAQHAALLQRWKEVSMSDDIDSNLISIVDKAEAPVKPIKPNKPLTLALALMLGTLLGSAIVFGLEWIDDRLKSPHDIPRKLGTITMGVVPRIKDLTQVSALLENSQSSVAESYASLRTNLQLSGSDGGPKVIHLTSARSGEGKSVSALGLALRYTGLGEKVLLIDGDMRLPTFSDKSDGSKGLSSLLISSENPSLHIQSSKFRNLDLLPSGEFVPNPSEILSSYRLKEVIDYAKAHYHRIIIDSPPVMGIADALILAAASDVSLLVAEYKGTRTPAIKAAIERLNKGKTKLLGVVMTKYRSGHSDYLDYYNTNDDPSISQYGPSAVKLKSRKVVKKQTIDIL